MRTERSRSWFHQLINGSIAIIDRSISQQTEHDASVIYDDTKILTFLSRTIQRFVCFLGQKTRWNIPVRQLANDACLRQLSLDR